ncbi:MAG: ABC transporter permease [Chloroflexi bacterium]|nr:ABC transporter permease [Chloroflexota bacterium]
MAKIGVVRAGVGLRAKRGWTWRVWVFCRKKPLGALGAVLLILMAFTAIFADALENYDPLYQDTPKQLTAPGREFWFGSDVLGRDVYSRVIHGSRVSLYVGLMAVLISTAIGTTVGVASAYFGGWLDLGIQRVIDALQGIPGLVLALALVVALGASLNNVTIAIAIAYIPRVTRIARAQALSVIQEDYVLAARAVGARAARIIFRHVTINSLTPVIVVAAGLLGNAIVTEAALSFLGLGVPPPFPSWGQMLQAGARGYQEAAPWLTIFPGLALTVGVFGFNLFGDALRDTLDPRLRGR